MPWALVTTTNSAPRSEEHTSELQSRRDLVCRLLLEKKKVENRPHLLGSPFRHGGLCVSLPCLTLRLNSLLPARGPGELPHVQNREPGCSRRGGWLPRGLSRRSG